jgi:aminoglycoside N3'-acetyltransferase
MDSEADRSLRGSAVTSEGIVFIRYPAAFDRRSALDIGEMGQIPAALLRLPDTVRSRHPSVSWAAYGPRAGY